MLLTGTLRRLDERPWNNLGRCETVQITILYVVHDILWKCHENSFTHFFTTLLRNTDPGNRKIHPGFKGLIATFQKCSRLFLISCQIFAENFIKICSSVFPFILLTRQKFPWKHRKRNPVTQGVKRDTFQVFQIVPCIRPDLSWKFHENPFTHFSVMLSTDKQTNKQTNRWNGNLVIAYLPKFVGHICNWKCGNIL